MFESKGWLRNIGSLLAGIGAIATQLPDPRAQAVGQVLLQLGGFIGGAGVLRAASQGSLTIK